MSRFGSINHNVRAANVGRASVGGQNQSCRAVQTAPGRYLSLHELATRLMIANYETGDTFNT